MDEQHIKLSCNPVGNVYHKDIKEMSSCRLGERINLSNWSKDLKLKSEVAHLTSRRLYVFRADISLRIKVLKAEVITLQWFYERGFWQIRPALNKVVQIAHCGWKIPRTAVGWDGKLAVSNHWLKKNDAYWAMYVSKGLSSVLPTKIRRNKRLPAVYSYKFPQGLKICNNL